MNKRCFPSFVGDPSIAEKSTPNRLLKEIVIEPEFKLEYVPEFCFFDDTFGGKRGVWYEACKLE